MTSVVYPKRVVVITGASRGIGRSCALELAQPNTHLFLLARQEAELNAVAKECEARGAQAHYMTLDLGNTAAIRQCIEDIRSGFGAVDILINNAGIWLEKPFEEGDMSLWDAALDVNLKSVMHITRYCLEGMPSSGAVIFVASTASRRSYAGGTNYCAAKFGLLGFANALFEDIKERGIKVSSILPGVVNTDMHRGDPKLQEAKMIQPEDVAKTVSFILSMPQNVCPTEITLMPQYNPKTPR